MQRPADPAWFFRQADSRETGNRGKSGAGDGEIAQPFAHEGEDLVSAAHRLDKIGVGLGLDAAEGNIV